MSAPALRFKDNFGHDYPEWGKFSFFDLLDDIWDYRGKTPTKLGMEWGGSIPSLSANNVKKGYIDFNAECNFGSEELYQKWMVKGDLSKNDIVFTMEAPLGNVALIPDEKKYILSQRVVVFKTKNWIENKLFLQILLSDNFQATVDALATGTTAKGINQKSLSKVVLEIPVEKSEQAKIANFLTAVDEIITQLNQKHDLLTQYKKGVMQQIFSQELRFKDDDGSDFPDWEETSLGNICKPQQWKTISASELTQFGYPAYGANGQIGFYSDYNHEDETVAVTCRGATCGEVSLVPPKSYITGNAMSLDGINHENNNLRFVYYALIHRGFRDVISGSAQPQIVGSAIRKVGFARPAVDEQAKIANFLTAIDDKITATQSQLQAVKQYKQGLLQQMFV